VTADGLFLIFNNAIIPAWLLLLVAPRWQWTQRLVHAFWIPLILAFAYALAIAKGAQTQSEGAGFFSLDAVMLFFTSPWSALAGWLHYLAFDLFVGAWEVRDSQRRGIAHGWVAGCLVCTMMLGPLGLGLYALLRAVRGRDLSLNEVAASE
jgi:hypothetical protein